MITCVQRHAMCHHHPLLLHLHYPLHLAVCPLYLLLHPLQCRTLLPLQPSHRLHLPRLDLHQIGDLSHQSHLPRPLPPRDPI